jgi:Flp pilus assembly pilin Flp
MKDVFNLILGICALVLIGYYSCWQVALGIFLFTWFHNIEKHLK